MGHNLLDRYGHRILYLATLGSLLEVPPVPDLASMVFEEGSIYLCPLDPEGGLGQKGNPARLDPSTFLLGMSHVVP
jgi:hypothetical protein